MCIRVSCDNKVLTQEARVQEHSNAQIYTNINVLLLFAVIPLLLMICQCGGAGTIFPDQFTDLPFDTKEHLIAYHTEGKGEDKVGYHFFLLLKETNVTYMFLDIITLSKPLYSKMAISNTLCLCLCFFQQIPLLSAPLMMGKGSNVEMAQAPNYNASPSKIGGTLQTTPVYRESVWNVQENSKSWMEMDNAHMFSRESFNHGVSSGAFSREAFGAQQMTSVYDDIALPDSFLDEYYSQVLCLLLMVFLRSQKYKLSSTVDLNLCFCDFFVPIRKLDVQCQ